MQEHDGSRLNRRLAAVAIAALALGVSDAVGRILVPLPALARTDAAPASPPTPAPPGPAPAAPDFAALVASSSVSDGAALASSQCAGCHSFAKDGPSLVGPDLYGVVGRRIASVPGYAYSSALSARHGVWTVDALDPWLANPSADVPGTKMLVQGVTDRAQRAQIIAFLASLKSGGGG